MHQEWIFQWLQQYAYQPNMVYMFVFAMMLASGFGFPLPEEVTIISVAVLAYMASQPDLYPPPYAGAPTVSGYEAAVVVSLAVLFSDLLVFSIGRFWGRKLMRMKRFRPFFEGPKMEKINNFVKKYGVSAAFIFRFTPGIRFPAHIFLGVSHFSFWAFLLVDSLAILISVPSQILLVFHFGEPILGTLYKFKTYVGIAIGVALLIFIARKLWQRFMLPQPSDTNRPT